MKDLSEGVMGSINEVTEKENNVVFTRLSEDNMCEDKHFSEMKNDLFGEVNSTVSDLNVSKNSEVSSMEDYRGELNTSDEKVEEEELEYNAQSEEECESQSEEDWKSVLKCPKCGDEHESKLDFLAHLQTHSGKSKPCVDCHKVFQNSITFKVHKQLQMCSSTSKMYKCKLCNKTLYAGSQYSAHLSAHKRNQCKTCGDHFAKRKHLQAHAMNVHNVSLNKDMFRCDVCERTFSQRRSLAYHYQIAHPDTTVCTVCLEIFGSQEELQDHQTVHKQQQLISCDQCDQQFSRRQQYLAHLKSHHTSSVNGKMHNKQFATSWRRDRKVGPYRGIIRGSATRFPAQRLSVHNLRSQPEKPSRNHPTRTCPEEFRMFKRVVSSAYKTELQGKLDEKSLIATINRKGPKTEPCGTPNFTVLKLDLFSPRTTICFLSDK
ncbi:hypothetical protein J6590_010534 [Homalodisca vitripennis]|nr:hypothetical protein J6590_010534 [Homalodisca vitripennis]